MNGLRQRSGLGPAGTRRPTGLLALVACAAVVAGVALATGPRDVRAQTSEAVDKAALRVCSDPNNLPYSNDAGEGFENKIAELFAAELGVPVRYTWYPNTVGFIRNTLRLRKCDLVLAAPTASELLQNTNPYYRSTYALIFAKASGITARSLADPVMQSLKIGVVAGTPGASLIAKYGLFDQMRPYHLMVDTRFESATAQMADDVAAGEIDAGILWGPIAGYHVKTHNPALVMVPLDPETEKGVRIDFRIHMGLRYNEPEWKQQLNDLIRDNQDKINAILIEYGVPLLDNQGRLINPPN